MASINLEVKFLPEALRVSLLKTCAGKTAARRCIKELRYVSTKCAVPVDRLDTLFIGVVP